TKYVKSVNNTNNDEKVKEIEMKIRQLQEELKRLKNDGGKN
ncbi:translocase, partial [Sulfolobus sp. A20-N-G8]